MVVRHPETERALVWAPGCHRTAGEGRRGGAREGELERDGGEGELGYWRRGICERECEGEVDEGMGEGVRFREGACERRDASEDEGESKGEGGRG